MYVVIVSDHNDLLSLVGDRSDITCLTVSPRARITHADLFIWDFTPDLNLRGCLKSHPAAQHLVLTEPKYLEALADIQGSACILLKPTNAFTLRAFIDLSLKTLRTHGRAKEAEALRGDRDALLQYVIEVNLKLQAYDQERSNFLARALHDFRAPLTALQGYCGLLAEGRLGAVSPTQQELLNRMSYSTRRLSRLANGTLELLLHGRVERSARFREECIQQALDQALHDVRLFIADKALKLEIDLQPPKGTLSFEAEQIQQVFVNLLENSCKFTPRAGTIEIRGFNVGPNSLAAAGYQIEISDSGPGVAADRAEWIFEEYASYSGADDRSAGGLGLAICRRILAAHNGTIWATPSQRGGSFSFVLPQKITAVGRRQRYPLPKASEFELECAQQS